MIYNLFVGTRVQVDKERFMFLAPPSWSLANPIFDFV